MGIIGVSMRMETVAFGDGKQEIRNCLADDWRSFFALAMPGAIVAPIQNWGSAITPMLAKLNFKGFILSGGDDWGIYPLRDETETLIWQFARKKRLPVLGVCRGAQVINILSGGTFGPAPVRHAGTRHAVKLYPRLEHSENRAVAEVNSFHNNCIFPDTLAPCFQAFAHAEDKTVEGFANADNSVCGIMWHPEREKQIRELDMQIIRQIFGEDL